MNNPTATTRVLSCGLLIESPAGWLLAHATRSPRWDLPKGGIGPDETPIQAALRETLEETGIDMRGRSSEIEDLGRHNYIPKKDLHLFRLRISEAFDLKDCKCSTMVTIANGAQYPETDRWEWIPRDLVDNYVGRGMAKYLRELGLLPSVVLSNSVSRSIVH